MAVYSLFFTFLIALALTNAGVSAQVSAEDQKIIDIQVNPVKKSINLEIELAKQIALTNSQNSNRNAAIEKITAGLISQLKPYLNLYTGDDSCSKTANFSITNAITRGAQYYANCVNSASTKSVPRIDKLVISAAAVNARTAATSIADFFTSCLTRIFSFNIFSIFAGCPTDFINGAIKFMNTTMTEVKNEIDASLSDSVKIAKCADDTLNEAFRVATISLNMYNFCKARLITTTQRPTTTTKSPNQPTGENVSSTTPTPTTPTTPQTTTPQPTPPPRSNLSAIIESAINRYKLYDDRINKLRQLINEAVAKTQDNYGQILNIDLLSISESITDAAASIRSRLENAKTRYSSNTLVQNCYKTADDQLNSLTNSESSKSQSCFFSKSEKSGDLVATSAKLEADLNTQQSQNGANKIAECASGASTLSNASVTDCVEKLLKDSDNFLTVSTNSVTSVLADSRDIVADANKCVSDATAAVRQGAETIYNDFRTCTGGNV